MDDTADRRLDELVASFAAGDRLPEHRTRSTRAEEPAVTLELLFEELSAQRRQLEQVCELLAGVRTALAAVEQRVEGLDAGLRARPFAWWSEQIRGDVHQ